MTTLAMFLWSQALCAGRFMVATAILTAAPTLAWAQKALDLQEEVVSIPVTVSATWVGQQTHDMFITVFRPKGKGPFPLVVINHGRASNSEWGRVRPLYFRYEDAARYFVRKGFIVLVPTRLGYGASGLGFDPEAPVVTGNGQAMDFHPMAAAAATEILAAVDYGRTLPGVDANRIVLVGQSVGGLTTVAAAAMNPPGVVAAINFAGGHGGDLDHHRGFPVCAGQLKDLFAEMGKQAHVPMLWIYTENDQYFAPDYTRAWAKAFAMAGGQVDYRLLPPFKSNGHLLFSQGCDIWMPLVEEYLARAGFREPGMIQRPQPTPFASIQDVDKVPYLGTSGREGYRKFLQASAPRAFAVGDDGHWGWAQGDNAMARALGNAQRAGGTASCRLYAVDAEVVW